MTLTALTVYGTTTNAVSVAGHQLVIATGTVSTIGLTSLCGTSTGFGELYAQGNVSAWGAFSAIQAANGQGFILEDAILNLAGQMIPAGNWTCNFRSKVSVGTLSVDMWCVAYKYNTTSQVYTQIGTPMSLKTQTITTTVGNFTFAPASQPGVNFGASDLLYFEAWLNINTNNSGSGSATVSIVEAQSSTIGPASNSFRVATPGYQPAVSAGGVPMRGFREYGRRRYRD